MEPYRMLGASHKPSICFQVHVNTFGKRDPKDRDCREPTSQHEYPVRNCDMVTRLIQIVNKPDQVALPKVFHALCILLAVKCVIEPIGELG